MKSFLLSIILCSSLLVDVCSMQDGKNEIAPSNANKTAGDTKSSRQIPPPDKAKCQSILDSEDWLNPFIVVQADRLSLTVRAIGVKNKVISTDELADAITALPISAWPCGRVVAVQEIGIVSGMDDLQRIKRNRERVERKLKSLEIMVDLWPSA